MKKHLFLLTALLMMILSANAQIDVKDKVKTKTTERADQRTDEGIDKSLDKIEEGIGSLFKKKTDKEDEESEAAEETESDENEEVEETESDESAPSAAPAVKTQTTVKSYSKFDFIPGEKVIFLDDFSQDPVGEFPARWNTNTGGEIVTADNLQGKWFQLQAQGGNYFPELDLDFPENVTIEFDLLMTSETDIVFTYYSEESFDIDAYGVPGEAGAEVLISCVQHNFTSYSTDESQQGREINNTSDKGIVEANKVAHLSIWIQKSRFRMYVNETKVFDIPKGVFGNHVYNRMRFETSNAETDALIGNVRIAVGAPDSRNQLITEGKFVTRGILFDVNSDRIKPESYGCIKEIADVLKENAGVKVMIIGHTDSHGSDANNLDLSKRRALSVKNFLVKEFGIDASRMETDGKGESEPVDSNSTPEGKAQNRRVEFVKL